jgi:hypothetical protein
MKYSLHYNQKDWIEILALEAEIVTSNLDMTE